MKRKQRVKMTEAPVEMAGQPTNAVSQTSAAVQQAPPSHRVEGPTLDSNDPMSDYLSFARRLTQVHESALRSGAVRPRGMLK